MKKLLVAVAWRSPFFQIDTISGNPWEAISAVKLAIEKRGSAAKWSLPDPEIGHSLVNAHRAGTLNYLVFEPGARGESNLVAGELRGVYQSPVSIELADAMRHFIPDALYFEIKRNSLREQESTALVVPDSVDQFLRSLVRGELPGITPPQE